MSRRLFVAAALTCALAASLRPGASADVAPTAQASTQPDAAATPALPAERKGARARAPLPTAGPLEVTAPSASPAPLASEEARPFVYLRDRYVRDDQGAALQKPITQLTSLDYVLGTWSAHIFTLTPDHRVTRDFGRTTYLFARTMNDRWILGVDAKNTEYLYFTYDPVALHWVYDDLKGFPSYGLSYATGNPRHLNFGAVVESALGEERRLRTTLTYVDAKHFTLLDEEETPDNEYEPVVEFDFTRK